MTDIHASLTNGSVVYHNPVEGRPGTTERTGNVTINNSAIPGIPGHFVVAFNLDYKLTDGEISVKNNMTIRAYVITDDEQRSYRDIEQEASSQLSIVLKQLAEMTDEMVTTAKAKASLKDPA